MKQTIDSGMNLYDLNKEAMLQESPLDALGILGAIAKIQKYFDTTKNQYYMLLNNELHDYTVLDNKEKKFLKQTTFGKDLIECLQNRGTILSIELQEDKAEIWLRIENECFVYYLFPYDFGVIEIE